MSSDRLTRLREKKAQIDAQLKQLEAREREQERRNDTRRKIIVGALALEHAEKDEAFGAELYRLIARYVDRPQDRALFGLAPKEGEPQEQAKEQDNLSSEFQSAQPAAGSGLGQ